MIELSSTVSSSWNMPHCFPPVLSVKDRCADIPLGFDQAKMKNELFAVQRQQSSLYHRVVLFVICSWKVLLYADFPPEKYSLTFTLTTWSANKKQHLHQNKIYTALVYV